MDQLLSLRVREIIDLFATDKSRYFAQPRRIIYLLIIFGYNFRGSFSLNFVGIWVLVSSFLRYPE